MTINKILFLVVVSTFMLVSCTKEKEADLPVAGEKALVNDQQRKLADIGTGRLQYRPISPRISCTGEIEIPPQGMASVTAPLGGFIVDTEMVPGKYVKKGTLLARLSNPEYITLQQSYLETSGQLRYAEQDYNRQRLLREQDATAVKKFQESESAYTVLKARLAGLKERLKLVGINFRSLENGTIQSVVVLRAPISGYITTVNHHPGQFVDPQEVIFEIVDMSDLHLHLNVFEQDIMKVLPGQSVRFRPAGGGADTWWGKVSLVSPKSSGEVRTFDVHAHIETGEDRMKPGMYVEAEILISDDSLHVLPEGALVYNGNNAFVLTEENGDYETIPVDTGVKMDGWVEIRNHNGLEEKNIVTRGASRLFTALGRGVGSKQ